VTWGADPTLEQPLPTQVTYHAREIERRRGDTVALTLIVLMSFVLGAGAVVMAAHSLSSTVYPHVPGGQIVNDFLEREPVVAGFAGLTFAVDLFIAVPAILGWVDLDVGQTIVLVVFVTVTAMLISPAVRDRVWSQATVSKLTHPSNGEPDT
jgi:hypothetical protein